MEKPNEYRDDLANKLREIRNSDEENPELAKAKAEGYLEAKKESNEYVEAKKDKQEMASFKHSLENKEKMTAEDVLTAVEAYLEKDFDRAEMLEKIESGMEAVDDAYSKGVVFKNTTDFFAKNVQIDPSYFGRANENPRDFVWYVYKSKIFSEDVKKINSLLEVLNKIDNIDERKKVISSTVGNVIGAYSNDNTPFSEYELYQLKNQEHHRGNPTDKYYALDDLLKKAGEERGKRFTSFTNSHKEGFEQYLDNLKNEEEAKRATAIEVDKKKKLEGFDPQI